MDDAIAGRDAVFRGGAGWHFKHDTDGPIRRNRAKRSWLGILFDPSNAAIALDEDHVKRDQRILHPHSDFLIAAKIKKHSLSSREPCPEHETASALSRSAGDFRHEGLLPILGDDRYGLQLLRIQRSCI
jgi:hypothetical protein